jgi:hypothetical protein
MISLEEFLMGREGEYPLTLELALNAASLLAAVNYIRGVYGKPMKVSSGYRPGHFNTSAKGAKKSPHLTCEAIDLLDPDQSISKWCLTHLSELEKAGLYLEEPAHTKGWAHLQTRSPASGNRVFSP